MLIRNEASAQFDDASTVARYLGEAVGTHYSAALRAAEAYGRHLASARDSLLNETFEGDGLKKFWNAVMESEHVRSISPTAHEQLATTPDHYFADFLETAETVFGQRYGNVPEAQRKKLGHTQHASCLRLLRDHVAAGIPDHFTVRNRVATWMQMIRVTGGYRD